MDGETRPAWSFTVEFDEEKSARNGYDVDTLCDYAGKDIEDPGNVRVGRGTWRASRAVPDRVVAQCAAQARLSRMGWFMQNIGAWTVREGGPSVEYDHLQTVREVSPQLVCE